MKSVILFLAAMPLFQANALQSKLFTYAYTNGHLVKQNSKNFSHTFTSGELPVRFTIKKFRIEKGASGSEIRWETICEKNSTIEVKDLTGGGLIQEQLLGACQATHKGYSVIVALGGMVYDAFRADFTDEDHALQKNFFTHLFVQNNGGPIFYGPGDFNLGATRDLPFKNWSSDLSTDNAGGGKSLVSSQREGFVAKVRYGK